jgi:hypothetical protein
MDQANVVNGGQDAKDQKAGQAPAVQPQPNVANGPAAPAANGAAAAVNQAQLRLNVNELVISSATTAIDVALARQKVEQIKLMVRTAVNACRRKSVTRSR